jgi:competence protein ComEC
MAPLHALAKARGQLLAWVPVALAFGIGAWFAWPAEPQVPDYALGGLVLTATAIAGWRGPYHLRPFAVLVACLAAGFLAAGARAHMVASPMLAAPYAGPVQGRIIDIDRSQSDALRLTLDRVVLGGLVPDLTPATVRLSLHGPPLGFDVTTGQTVMLSGRLDAPQGPEEPGGFDFRRMAYFEQLGAVGYSQTPVMLWAEPAGWDQAISRLRLYLSHAIEAAVPGDAGAFASGSMTGDRSGINAQVVQDLRVTSLAHLLAISGMNLAFLTGFVFALVRGGLALWPAVALRMNTKKVAAVVAFAVSSFYLALSGANVATTRAFLMMVVFLAAVLLDRRALSLRNVAISATVLLLWQPESLMAPGFQMSYAATVALIAGFDALREAKVVARLHPWMRPPFLLVMTSVIAGFATAPFAAAEFNRLSNYALIANLLTVPVMSLLMGAGAVAALLAPIGLAYPALWVMGQASAWILWVAHEIATLGGAMTAVPQPMAWVIPLFTLGSAWVVLWRGRVRGLGLAVMALAFGLWAVSERPVALVSSDGALVGVLGPDGRALSSASGAGFAAQTWLQDDGDLATPKEAALRAGFTGPKGVRQFTLAGLTITVLAGKAGLAALPDACAKSAVVILAASQPPPAAAPGPCQMIDASTLAASGALSLVPGDKGISLVPVRRFKRIWDDAQAPAAPIFLARPAELVAGADQSRTSPP